MISMLMRLGEFLSFIVFKIKMNDFLNLKKWETTCVAKQRSL